MNAHNERFNKTIQDMFVSYNEDLPFTDLNEFNRKMAKWLIDYNTILTHTSLGYKIQWSMRTKSAACCGCGHLFAVFLKKHVKIRNGLNFCYINFKFATNFKLYFMKGNCDIKS